MKTIRQETMLKTLIGLIVLLFCCGLYLTFSSTHTTGVQAQDLQQQKEDFKEKLEYYLDLKSQGFLNWLVAKEKQLVELIKITSGEVKKRTEQGADMSQFNFAIIYAKTDTLVSSYDREITRLIEIYEKLDSLEIVVSDSDIVIWEDVAKAKDDLVGAIEE